MPLLSAQPAPDVVLGPDEWALLCKVDGDRSIADLAGECGFTLFEAGHVVRSLMDAGLIDVELPDDEPVASVTSLEDARGKRPAFEAVFTALSIHDQVAPPTANLIEPSPECDLDYVPRQARNMKIEVALSNSFGFGGTNAVIALKRFKG